MPSKPLTKNITKDGARILNAIRNEGSSTYLNAVPIADPNDVNSLREIGAIINENNALKNEFLDALINRIGRVMVTTREYSNPWATLKKGVLEFGETIEEVFVNIAKPFTYDPSDAENSVFKREIPDVRSAFHLMNYRKYYKVTVQNDSLRSAFLSWEGIYDLVAKITDSLYSASAYDEFQVMKYLLAKNILNGELYPVAIEKAETSTAKAIVSEIKATSNAFEFMDTAYNKASVYNSVAKRNQVVLLNSKFDAIMDVEVLASAFNMDKAEFIGRRILVDGFGKIDSIRLTELLGESFEPISAEDLAKLNEVPCVLMDENYMMVYDNMTQFTENYNGGGLYWNYFYHVWKTFSTSPFANVAVFTPVEPSVVSVSMNQTTATISVGGSLVLTADVTTTGFASKKVTWESNNDNVTVENGRVTVHTGATGSAEIKAISVYDTNMTATCKVTIA